MGSGWLLHPSVLSQTAWHASVTGLQPPGHRQSRDCSAKEKSPSAARKALQKHMSTEEGVKGKNLNFPSEASCFLHSSCENWK